MAGIFQRFSVDSSRQGNQSVGIFQRVAASREEESRAGGVVVGGKKEEAAAPGFFSRFAGELVGTLPVVGKLAGKSESLLGNVFEKSAEVAGGIARSPLSASVGPLLEETGLAKKETLENVPFVGDIRAPGAKQADLLAAGKISKDEAIKRGLFEAGASSLDVLSWLYGGKATTEIAKRTFLPALKETAKVGVIESLIGLGYGTSDALSDGDDLEEAIGRGLEVAALTGAAGVALPAVAGGVVRGLPLLAQKGAEGAIKTIEVAESIAKNLESKYPFPTTKAGRASAALGEAKKTLENAFLPQDYLVSKRTDAGKKLVELVERKVEVHELGKARDNMLFGGRAAYDEIDTGKRAGAVNGHLFVDYVEGRIKEAPTPVKQAAKKWEEVAESIAERANKKYTETKSKIDIEIAEKNKEVLRISEKEHRLYELQEEIDADFELLQNNPARALKKYINRETRELPDVTGKVYEPREARKLKLGKGQQKFIKEGDQIITELGFADDQQAFVALERYLEHERRAMERVQEAKSIRGEGIRVGRSDKLLAEVASLQKRLDKLEKSDWGKLLPGTRKNFYPHQVITVESIASQDEVFRDVVANLVRKGVAGDKSAAKKLVFEFGSFVKGQREAPKKIIDDLVKNGQAADEKEAIGLMLNFRKAYNSPSFGGFKERRIDLPFYDPNPSRVISRYIDGANKAIAEAETYGINNSVKKRLLGKIMKEGGEEDAGFAKRFLAQVDRNDLKMPRLARWLLGFEIATKMDFSVFSNATQGVNTLLQTDLPSWVKGYKLLFSKGGQEFAAYTGAATKEAIGAAPERIKLGLPDFVLKAQGFDFIEGINRKQAALANTEQVMREMIELKKNPQNLYLRNSLKARMGNFFDIDEALKKGKIDTEDLLLAGFRGARASQFFSSLGKLPQWVNEHPTFRMMFQLKSFAVHQTRFLLDQTVGELRRGSPGRAARNLLLISTIFPLAGEGKEWLRNTVMGVIRPYEDKEVGPVVVPKEVARWVDDIAAVGGFGVVSDLFSSMSWGKLYQFAAGPVFSEIIDPLNDIGIGRNGDWLIRRGGKMVPFTDPIINRYFPTKFQKDLSEVRTPQLVWPIPIP